ncbi:MULTISPECIES: PAS-domain containing protein [unclassified Ruegeria]|uniref:PAS-domain containing protein n=2 Tax=Ruegeria TaxID=97050 RepID=UPI001490DC45|nr:MULTISPECIES: PAS-domain containing protein [unclassified Ruegeria]NOD88162.1 PAS domain-containing protein [Ruegeria sp. HKCCD4318]NOE15010.1 PAS domain-containing protein [Ruegeria sp. HKCCD4318-2]NOG11387.1 PAS domain-containing protein [Ruegeria sp. HKCCD4315]
MNITEKRIKAMTTAGLNLIGQALSIYDSKLQLVLSNRRFQEMFGLPDELVQRGALFRDTIHFLASRGEYGHDESVEDMVNLRVEQALAFEPHYMERVRPNGQVVSIEGAPLPQGGWVAVYTDITGTRRAENLLRARSEELSEQLLGHAEELSATNRKLAATIAALEEAKRELTEIEARTRLVTEMMPAHIAHLDSDGLYDYSNRRLSAVMPGRPSDILGLHISEALGAVAFARVESHLQKAYDGEQSVFEFTEDQDSRRIRVSFTPDGAGGVYVMSVDITEETQARVALQQTRRRAMAAQMTSGLAHDFSNLLTIILGMQSRLDKMHLPDEAQELVVATQQTARRGGQLLNRIADMTGNRTPQPQATDMRGLLEDLRILATPSLPRGMGLSVVNTLPDQALMLDPGMVQDALLNLILNARDACGSSGQITISAHAIGNIWVEITVSDTGPGFSAEALEKALNPFFTTKGSDGSGLGLPMVYDTVKLTGGDLNLKNTPSGASVVLRLPYRPAPPARGGLVLLVEDSDELRGQFRDMLVELGLSVIEANSVDEAVALLSSVEDISMVLSDIRLEGGATGLELMEKIKPGFPCILMTSLPNSDLLHQQALALAPVLQKPFSQAQLSALIQTEAA